MLQVIFNCGLLSTTLAGQSKISEIGPPGYGTGPGLMNNFGPVPDQRLQRKLNNTQFIWQWFHPKCSKTVNRDIIRDWSHGL